MLNEMEQRVLEMLLAGNNETLAVLRDQLKATEIVRREFTGAGFNTYLSVPADLARLKGRARLVLGDVDAEIAGLQHAAGFRLFVSDGAIDVLECFIFDDRWPDDAALRRLYYVRPAAPGSPYHVETKERDVEWALRNAV